jgi:hypothetical protein
MPLINEPLIISVDDIRSYTAISDNFDSQILAACIKRAQDLNCRNILGTALTNKLVTDYNSDSLTGIYETLYDSSEASVRLMVVWQAYVYGLPRMAFKIQNSGISKTGGDIDATVITNEELGILQREAKGALTAYENNVKRFIQLNYSDIPELSDSTPEYIKPNTDKSTSDFGMSYSPTRTFDDI